MVARATALVFLALFLAQGQSDPQSTSSDSQDTSSGAETPPPVTCPAGGPIGDINLRVQSPENKDALPFRNINHLTEGDTLLYSPIFRGHAKRPGEIALVFVPAKRSGNGEALIVTDPKAADKPQQWKIPQTISVAAFVYGPQGLSKKKVKGFLSQDDLLIAQLADYAEKTAQTEALIQALESTDSSSASVNAALSGFASQYGLSVQLDRSAPPAAQAQTLFATMNPQLATYNPLASSTAERVGQTASLTAAAATLFFGSPIGLAAGGTAMLLDLRAIAFPDTQFRSSFAQPLKNEGLNLCGQRGTAPPHTRVAFIWASRIPNTPAPDVKIGQASYIPESQKTSVPVEVPDTEWKYLQRARNWTLDDEKGHSARVAVLKLGNQRAIEIDLHAAKIQPGDYRLSGFWDWTAFHASGEIHVRPLSTFTNAKLDPASQDRLLARAGKVAATLTGDDFEFTTKTEIKKLGDEFASPETVPFILHKGLRNGPQEQMDVQIDTSNYSPGAYALLISQQDGRVHQIPFRLLPKPPKIDNLPVLANQGVATQHYVLKGERLDLITRLEATGAKFQLEPARNDGTEREIQVQLDSDPKPGTTAPIEAFLQDRTQPVIFSDALQITGPLPVVASSRLSLPQGTTVALLPDEFPAGYTLSAMLDVKNVVPQSALHLACADGLPISTVLRVGEQTPTSTLQRLSPDQLFLSLDTSTLPSGCALQAVIDNGRQGKSQPNVLAQIVRLPQIDSLQATGSPDQSGKQGYLITGTNLEMIEKAGWTNADGQPVAGLPTPLAGPGQKQSLQISLPAPPAPQAPLFVWLRGDKAGRSTSVLAPAASTPPNTGTQPQSTSAVPHEPNR